MAWLSLARLLNLGLSALLVPLMIHFLGGEGFAVWALLLGAAAIFAQLDLGMPPALARHIAVPIFKRDTLETSRLASTAITFGAGTYGVLAPAVLLGAQPLAAWLKLPSGRFLTSMDIVVVVYVGVAVRSILQHGNTALYAAREFRLAAQLSFFQAFLSNLGATLGAGISRAVDVTLLCFWAPQLLVMASAFFLAGRKLSWRISPRLASWSCWRGLVGYGLKVQAYEWSQTLAFQVTKLIVLRSVGLWGVARYEAAGRAVMALRSVPAAGTDAFMPSATVGLADGQAPEGQLRRMFTLAGHGALLFIVAPAAISPLLLYAWVGEMGYVSRWTFAALAFGAAASLLALPGTAMAQALGRPDLQAKAGLASLVLTIPLGIGLGYSLGVEGAALGAGLAMCAGAAFLFWELSRAGGVGASAALREVVGRLWPMGMACLVWGVFVHRVFGSWLAGAPVEIRYSIPYRVWGALAAGLLYIACVLSMMAVRMAWGSIDEEERALLMRARAMVGLARP